MESGDGPPSHFNYVAFGEGIPQGVKRLVVNRSNVEEFRLNGSTVADRFREGDEKILLATTFDEYKAATPSRARDSSLVAQMRQLKATQGDRVHIVKLSDGALQSTDGEPPGTSIILDTLRQQPAPSRMLTTLQSIHEMLFRKFKIIRTHHIVLLLVWLQVVCSLVKSSCLCTGIRTQGPRSVSNNTAEESDGQCPHHEDRELPNGQPPRDEDDNEDGELP